MYFPVLMRVEGLVVSKEKAFGWHVLFVRAPNRKAFLDLIRIKKSRCTRDTRLSRFVLGEKGKFKVGDPFECEGTPEIVENPYDKDERFLKIELSKKVFLYSAIFSRTVYAKKADYCSLVQIIK